MQLTPGLVAYKFIVDGNWILDPDERCQKYEGGIANSAVQVPDCSLPALTLADARRRRGRRRGRATSPRRSRSRAGHGAPGLDPSTVRRRCARTARRPPITGVTVDAARTTICLDVPGLADGKYTIFVDAKDHRGAGAREPLRLVFWVEAERVLLAATRSSTWR